jgi:hypothetical protein
MTSRDTASRGEQLEGVVQVLIMLVIGGMAGAASFTHVHDVATSHGQPDWIGWADAVVVELMSIALGLELRRRARSARPTTFVMTALVFFIACSLAAQVVEAELSVIGWLAAGLPALGFLALAKVVLSRTAAKATPSTVDTAKAEPAAVSWPPANHEASAVGPTRPVIVDVDAPEPERATLALADPIAGLLPGARTVTNAYQQATGQPITADILADRLRIPVDVAEQLLTTLGERIQPRSARINGQVLQEAPL